MSTPAREDRLLAALCYPFWPLSFLIVNLSPVLRRDPFVRHHAFQGLFLGSGLWLGGVALKTLTLAIGRYLWVLGLLFLGLEKLLSFAALALTLLSALMAFQGRLFDLPLAGELARSFAQGDDRGGAGDPSPPGSRPDGQGLGEGSDSQ